MKKIIISILMSVTLISISAASIPVQQILNNPENYSETVPYENRLYNSNIPTTVYLMLNDRTEEAIQLVNEGKIKAGQEVVYKGRPYSDLEWARLRGYDSFYNQIIETEAQVTAEERIQRNRRNLFSNMELIQLEKDREARLLENVEERIQEIKDNEEYKDAQNIFRKRSIDTIIQGYNRIARYYLDELDNINETTSNYINPLMATGFSEGLDGGNVEMALILIYEYGADPHFKNEHEMNIIHIAAASNAYKVIFAMADNKVSFLNIDTTNKNPIDYAVESESLESLFILNKLLELWNIENGIQ